MASMGYVEDTPRPSVPPPGWTPADAGLIAPLSAGAVVAETPDRSAEAAVRWRISAAVIDNIIVYGGYLVLCLLLRWRVGSLDHLVVLLLGGVAYHFVFEARDGQTIGKRQYGIRVVSIDGSRAGARAVAIRSVLRIVDQLPVCYVSGLVNMIRTGPERRQRIGDTAADTKVVAIGGYAARKGTPGWMLPTATLVALVISIGTVYVAAEAGNQPLTDTQRSGFIGACQAGVPGQLVDCGCVLSRIEAAGYDSPNAIRDLFRRADSELLSRTTGKARFELTDAVNACRR